MVERKMLDVQKVQSHLNTIKAMAQMLLNEVEKVESMIEAKQSKRAMDSDAEQALIRLNHLRKCEKRVKAQ